MLKASAVAVAASSFGGAATADRMADRETGRWGAAVLGIAIILSGQKGAARGILLAWRKNHLMNCGGGRASNHPSTGGFP